MNCWFCGTELIWDNDFDYEDFDIDDREGLVTVLTCPKCNSQWGGYYDIESEDSNK